MIAAVGQTSSQRPQKMQRPRLNSHASSPVARSVSTVENLKKIEEHIEQIAKLAASCNLSRDDIIEMITFGMEEQE